MQNHVENIPASRTVYMRRAGAYGEQNYKLMQNMKEWLRHHNLWHDSGVIYGIAQDNPTVTPLEQCRYDVCFVTEQACDDNAVLHGTLPPGTYLVVQIPHTAEEVGRFWGAIESVVAIEGRQIDESRPILERYQFSLVERGRCEFCIPILG